MARLYEYQGKQIYQNNGIPIPVSVLVEDMNDLMQKKDTLSYPLAIKGQILSGHRGQRGAIRFAVNESELLTNAKDIIDKFDCKLLLEAKQTISQEYYFSITGDPSKRMPVIMMSLAGGMEVEDNFNKSKDSAIYHVNILEEFYPYQARDIAIKAGAKGKDINRLANVITNAYNIYKQYDCSLVEINPLCIVDHYAMALDSKVVLDDDAISRHADLGFDMFEDCGERAPTDLEYAAGEIDEFDHRGSVHFVQIDPDLEFSKKEKRVPIGFDGVGGGSSMVMFDELIPLGYQPVNFCDTSGNPVGSKLYRITKIIMAQKGIEGYIFAICVPSSQQNDNLVRGIIKAFREIFSQNNGEPDIPAVFAIGGTYKKEAYEVLSTSGYTNMRWVSVMVDATHQQIAEEFDRVYKQWKKEEIDG